MLPLSCKYFLSLPRTQLVCIAIHIWHTHTHTLSLFLSFFLCYCDQKEKEKLFPSLILYASHLHPASLIFANIINNKLSMSHQIHPNHFLKARVVIRE